jgi:hypothetical protein
VIAGEVIPYLRYVAPSFIIGIALFSSLLAPSARYHRVFRVAAVVALVSTWPGMGKSLVISVLAGGLTGWLVLKERAIWLSWLSRFAAAALFIAVPVLAARQKVATDRGVALTGSDEQKPIGAAWAALDRLPDGARVAALTNMAYHRSPLFGTRWQLSPIFLHYDGTVRIPFHEEFRKNPNVDWSFHEEWPTIDGEAWLARLRTSGVEYLLISRWADDDWPPSYAKLRATGHCETLFDDGYSVIWKLPR